MRAEMEFSERELELIVKAKKKAAEVRVKRIVIILVMMVGIVLMVTGIVGADKTAYLLVAAVFFSLGLPQFGDGPKYEDLVLLLDKKANSAS
jgi:hypothetical protein